MGGCCGGDDYESQPIAIATLIYNSREEVRRLYESFVPREQGGPQFWLVIDGPFNDIVNKEAYSTDGTQELIESFQEKEADNDLPLRIIYDNAPYREDIKRNRYLELCRIHKINWLIIMDSDEYFVYYDWNAFRNNWLHAVQNSESKNVYNMQFIVSPYGSTEWYRRCWFNPGEMEYINNSHYQYVNKENYRKLSNELKVAYVEPTAGNVLGLTGGHDHELKSNSMMEKRVKYQQWLRMYEAFTMNGASHEDADRLAKLDPHPREYDGCICKRCIEFFNVDLNKIFDPRTPDKRDTDPYAEIRLKRKSQQVSNT